MPITPTYPGVYIEEIPSGVRTITGVATSITAFIGRALRGPVNEAKTINSYSDFERIFGGLWVDSTLGYAVRDFYMNGGSQAIIVRLVNPNFATDASRDSADAAAKAVANATKATADGAAAKAAAEDKAKEYEDTPEEDFAKAVFNAINKVDDDATPDVVSKVANKAVGETIAQKAILTWDRLTLKAISEGTWGNYLRARVDHDVPEEDDLPESYKAYGCKPEDLFNITIRDTRADVTEVFLNVTVKPSPRQIDNVLKNESNLVRVPGNLPNSRPKKSDDGLTGDDLEIEPFSPQDIKENKRSVGVTEVGTNGGLYLKIHDFAGTGMATNKRGLYALEQTDLFNLLCIPPYKQPTRDDDTGDIHPALVGAAAAYCEKRRAMLLVDPPSSWTSKDAPLDKTTGVAAIGTNSKNAALFFPRLRQPNPEKENRVESFVPCGAVAGIFARTDTQRGVWKAPAGLDATLVNVPKLSVSLTDKENGELNPLGINCLRAMPAAGRVVWGARTLKGADRLASEWKYIPVRRLALYIEESLYRATQWAVFEPNDEPLWAQLRLNIGAFMQNLFRQGAFQGSTPQEAYLVKCDKETTTQNDINLGIVNIVVGFAPLKPAEFVILKIKQLAGQIAT